MSALPAKTDVRWLGGKVSLVSQADIEAPKCHCALWQLLVDTAGLVGLSAADVTAISGVAARAVEGR
jgi:hypothetical protein